MWNEFNIKTFPAETMVFRDGVFCDELSTLKYGPIDKNYGRPVHIIFVGEIAGNCRLNIDISAESQPVFLSARVDVKKPAFFNIFIKNTGKNSEFRGHVFIDNASELKYDCIAEHSSENTGVLIQNRVFGREKSVSEMSGTAIIDNGCENCVSDLNFAAMMEKNARVTFSPRQRISAIPQSAEHGAAIYYPTDMQVNYLRSAGLSGVEVDAAMRDAFMNDFSLF